MRSRKNLLTVLKFEFLTCVKNKPYIITLGIINAIILIICLLPVGIALISNITKDKPSKEINSKAIYYIEDGNFKQNDLEEFFPSFIWTQTDDFSNLEELVKEDEFDVGLYLGKDNYKVISKADKLGGVISENTIIEMIQHVNVSEFYKEIDLTQTEINFLLGENIKGENIFIGKDISQTYWVGYVLVMILYFSIITNSQSIMSSVATEKSTKTMEILLSSVDIHDLLFGKVIGVALSGILQLLSYFLTTTIGILLTKNYWLGAFPSALSTITAALTPRLIILYVIFFMLGFLVYSFLYAGFASTISRIEDAGTVSILPTLLIIVAFTFSISLAAIPNSMAAKISSLVPFLSPFVMFMRISVTDISNVVILIAIIINILTVIVSGIFGTRLYKAGVLMYGKSPSLKEIFKTVFGRVEN